ncbi:hypothetical protein KBB89_03505 [Candidatus Gracilibacteria bacterium]|nr:hypothetical protein [Candidatus Gracilibacteria bacterium]
MSESEHNKVPDSEQPEHDHEHEEHSHSHEHEGDGVLETTRGCATKCVKCLGCRKRGEEE